MPTGKPPLSDDVNYEFGPTSLSSTVKEKKPITTEATTGLFGFLTSWDCKLLAYLTITATIIRLAFLNHPSVVIFDEVHFGGFARRYLKGEYFFDLHPPLARLLVALSAWIGRWDAKFSFYDIGADYLKPGVPYVMMRGFCAVAGVLVMPIAFITLRAMEVTPIAAAAMASALIFENALLTQSRLILLDAYLVLFTALVGLFWALLRRQQQQRPFSWEWKVSLVGLGVSMACAASCKWVGLFAVAAIGLYTIIDLWRLLGDTSITISTVGKHLWSRVLALIIVPVAIYVTLFQIHFALLTKHNIGAATMSLEFQQTLQGGELPPTMESTFYGSQVRLRQYLEEGPFLHSHIHQYPTGSKQQQVTGYHHRDDNNLWIIRRPLVTNVTYTDADGPNEQTELVPLRHGDLLRLEHFTTHRFLHSHPVAPPLSNKEKQNEVSGYAHHPSKFSDLNDNWVIEIVDENGNSITKDEEEELEQGVEGLPLERRPPIMALVTKFRLRHKFQHCYLHCRNKRLPEWGFGQAEITCGKETLRSHQIWIIESNNHPAADDSTVRKIVFPKASFWKKFVEMNRKMWSTNAGLSSEHPFGSRPESWPLLERGVGFWNGNHVPKTEKQYKAFKKKEGKPDTEGEDSDAYDNDKDEEEEEEVIEMELESEDGKELSPGELEQRRQELREQRAIERKARKDARIARKQQQLKEKAEEEGDETEKAERARLAQEYIQFKGQQIYLLGNPAIWWATSGVIGLYVMMAGLAKALRRRRGTLGTRYLQLGAVLGVQIDVMSHAAFLFIQWVWHYVPFFGMKRQLFLHHYLPALYFAALLMAVIMDTLLNALFNVLGWRNTIDGNSNDGPQAQRTRLLVWGLYLGVVIYVFWRLAPLGYGLRMSKSQCEAIKWLSRWDFDCSSLVDPVSTAIITGN